MRTVLLWLLVPVAFAQKWVVEPTQTDASLRGVNIVDSKVVWASGTGGTFLRTADAGSTWIKGSVPGGENLDFRGVQGIDAKSAVLMASGEGKKSALFKTSDGGKTWSLLSRNPDPKGFFDAIGLTDESGGFLLGDPVGGSFTLFRFTLASGALSRISLPSSPPEEGAFAASNTSLTIRGDHIWFATGGKPGARVFRSVDGGASWSVTKTDMGGSDGSGIFSIAFRDEKNGIAVGGNYAKPKEIAHNIAVTSDGGVTWNEITEGAPRGYRSAVAWLPEHRIWIATGPTGSEFSRDDGQHWTRFDDASFNAISVGPKDVCFAVGAKGRIARLELAAAATRQ